LRVLDENTAKDITVQKKYDLSQNSWWIN